MKVEEHATPRLELGRRGFLLGSGGLVAALGASRAPAQPSAPADALAQWNTAPMLPLWNRAPPGGDFRPQTIPPGSPATFMRNVERPYLKVFRPERPNGRSLLSIPGGAYTFVSIANEGLDVANDMTKRGYTVFVLVYRLPGEGWTRREDVPLQDAQRAVRLIRAHSDEYRTDPAKLYAVGFSAGGHLAASLATDFAQQVYSPADATDAASARPRAMGLIYPVISHEPGIGHAESSLRLLGEKPSAERVARRSPALHVTADTPPSFLVHAMDDPAVPVENSFIMERALREQKRPVEAHFFEEGGHGFGLGPADRPVRSWIDLFANWIERQEAIAAKTA